MKVCIAPSRVLSCPTMGGHAWVYCNWTLGLQDNGCQVVWIERFRPDVTTEVAVSQFQHLRSILDAAQVRAEIALILTDDQRTRLDFHGSELEKQSIPLEAAASDCDVLMNFYYALEPELLRLFRRTVLMDIDPGLLQCWISQRQLNVARHDLYFTIGETVNATNPLIPDCGLHWRYMPPVVHLDSWPVSEAGVGSPYTTVSNWWAGWEQLGGELFSNEKRTSFIEYLELPAQVSHPLELAVYMHHSEAERQDRELLRRKGWRVQNPATCCATPEAYRQYVQASRGEFSCAKPSCMKLSNAWISDRTLCYLASGKPAIVQYTGASGILPNDRGLFRFRNFDEAVRALKCAEQDYERNCDWARSLVEEHFDARQNVARLLSMAT